MSRACALGLPEVDEEEPWGPHRPVYKVGGKIFATLAAANASQPDRLSVKCESALALHLYEQYPAVRPGYGYQGPRWHWITVHLDGAVPDEELAEMISHSWQCVVDGLPRTARDRLHRLDRDQTRPPAQDRTGGPAPRPSGRSVRGRPGPNGHRSLVHHRGPARGFSEPGPG
ncbi:hypothetical protein BLA24_33405 [Streptomyces cinnamoneus]|uniref:MmcQ/YjbR family DNA-binding protein n=1 Tax=Streptomyces cinnamoneus TaxID=53446 RepID=A0A2G1XAQ1_STRCJ|nr:MmcQ/YjbR family DNA-binding protein [Streptomyces cinnamoneus]PHQ48300.1 hypothetical protein BLA24_33405 [Streptomyces cinnamoneus]PPT15931.1 hypothetical protein CYQ11_26455 [Streptomyces cinnamoneus]